MRTTIKMIAERAGVSIGTVDRVLHDRPYVKAEVCLLYTSDAADE